MVYSSGVWEHTCPSCSHVTVFTVEAATWRAVVQPRAVSVRGLAPEVW